MQAALVDRYGGERLPRYTSYPTAPHFSAAVTHDTYAQWLAELPAGLSGSIYIHIPFCRSMCWYCGCHTTITRRDDPIIDYVAVLRREIDLVAGRLADPLDVRHVHFGGGTPTILEPEAFVALAGLLRQRFVFAEDAEIAIEIDPRTLSEEMSRALGEAGVTRASLGVQSFDPIVQAAVNRVQSFEQTAAAVEWLRAAGVSGINFDLIYGLPHQSVGSCIETARRSLELRPDRFAVFGYAHVPAFKKHQRQIDEAALPDGPARLAQAEAIAGVLTDAGYIPVGLDHYALPGDHMAAARSGGQLHRNFQGYTTDAGEVLLGFGASAIGRLAQGYVQNEVPLGRYAEAIGEGRLATVRGHALTPDDRLRAEIIERLMCDLSVDVGALLVKYGQPTDAWLDARERLEPLAADGLVRLEGDRVSVPEEARILVRHAAWAFDAYAAASARSFSKAI